MAAASDSDTSSSSSSSSSSSDGESPISPPVGDDAAAADAVADEPDDGDGARDAANGASHPPDAAGADARDDDDDGRKAFLSRIPQTFDEASIVRVLEGAFGVGCVVEASIVRADADGNGNGSGRGDGEDSAERPAARGEAGRSPGREGATPHRGFGFVTFASTSLRRMAVDAGTVRGSAKKTSKRKHTLYIRPVIRDDEQEYCRTAEGTGTDSKNVCFLWKKHRCPYGDGCKFAHEGEGGCLATEASTDVDAKTKKKRQKCFSFKKNGKCKLGDDCPFSHDFSAIKTVCVGADDPSKQQGGPTDKKTMDKSLVDCINWKNKGKCRKGSKCPYRHDQSVRDRLLEKKRSKAESGNKRKRDKDRRPLSVRVFGLNYDTSPDDVRAFFAGCGPIVEVTFPTFEDSGRSKGYCGVLFQSPKAVEKAVALDGSELHGRWLRIQEGKMFLRKWGEAENDRRTGGEGKGEDKPLLGEYGQKVKKRKRHGFKD